MAVTILERNADTLQTENLRKTQLNNSYSAVMTADEQHNSQISEVYQRLINPNAKIDDILGRAPVEEVQKPRDIFADRPYLVENARADAEIFRADSPVNRRVVDIQPQVVAELESEEENEDLRPTQTTIQYKTTGVQKTFEEGKIENVGEEKRAGLSKKEKIVIGAVIGVIVAMFVLIIVNSAILSGITADVSSLQASLTTVKASYAGISDEVNSFVQNAVKNAEEFAIFLGLVK